MPLQVFAITCTILLLSACSKDSSNKTRVAQTYTIYSDFVYKAKADVLASINGNPSQSIDHAGKLYIKDNYIYLNEVKKGIHIIDNSNPSHPVQVAFLSIPGIQCIAFNRNILVAGDRKESDLHGMRRIAVVDNVDAFLYIIQVNIIVFYVKLSCVVD